MRQKIFLVQPALPEYRVSFFKYLNQFNSNIDIYVATSKSEPNGAVSVDQLSDVHLYMDSLATKKIPLLPAYWQSIPFFLFSKMNKNDYLILNGNPRYLSNFFLFFIAKILRVKTVWWGHAWSSTSTKRNLMIRIRLAKFFDKIILYTEKEAALFVENGISNKKLLGINNGIDVDEIRKGFSFKGGNFINEKKTVLFLGRITNKARLDLLIYALSLIDEVKRPHLIVVGDGPQKAYCQTLGESNGLSSCITWFGEEWELKRINDIMYRSDIFVYPGAVGLSLIHAFANGLPAIVHSDEKLHMPEIAAFKNNYNGLSFTFDDAISLKSSIEKLTGNNDLLEKCSENAYNTVTLTFNTNDMAKRFLDFLY